MANVKSLIAAVAALIMAAQAAASDAPKLGTTKTEVSAFLGLTWTFGSAHAPRSPGISLKVLSTNKRDFAALAAGMTYNFDNTWGCDVGLAYNFSDTTMTGSWDICKRAPQIGVGGTKRPEIIPVRLVN
ncbi:hypothetical protein [Rhodobacter maris]|uniref:Uncharacterized protein n=1 Tax=Rhodobacter maris TaxID=446682 RepID=A0A285TGJ0_9RHOB|nr:hypothetical protein [Rhodobacter maris]SOC21290.1 hypothetical protein SAMN05877831_12219 [Rhodobacter maris]